MRVRDIQAAHDTGMMQAADHASSAVPTRSRGAVTPPTSCYGLNCVPARILLLKFSSLVPQNMTSLGNGVFADVITYDEVIWE